ncbi:VirB4 family type IV secretion system protein [Alicyclobacillus mengziensis]|uniref:TraC-like domain-containing protein n=1 Tax=Alicyclobacillus mengziensis TaxID=2931921 RepID=A0A9X7W4C0_9BACL|nr:hypothetical protein [Alicyclobacillus mengziensis]QSO50112.1 hypothetical protein JZ786_24665 [Alicyclobacillus mengziensis]
MPLFPKNRSKKQDQQRQTNLPITDIEQDYLKRSDGRYVALASVSPINMNLLAQQDVERAVDALRRAYNSIPERLQILISSERLNLSEYIEYLRTMQARATKEDQINRLESSIQEIGARSVKSQKVLRFYIALESKFTKQDAAVPELLQAMQKISDALAHASLHVTRLTKTEVMALLYQKLCPDSSLFEPATKDMTLHDLYPAVIDTKTSHRYYVVDETYFRSYTISSYPTKKEKASWLSEIAETSIDLDISITLQKADKFKQLRHLNSSVNAIGLEKQKAKRNALRRMELDQEEEDALETLRDMANDGESLFATTVVLTIREHTLEALWNSDKNLHTSISSAQMRSRPLVYYAKEPLWYTLPLCYRGTLENHVRYDMPSKTVASMQPFNSSTLATNDGIILGNNDDSHDLIILGNALRAMNPHTFMVAKTRQGKSFALFSYICREMDQGEVVIDIDPDRERENIPGEHIYFSLAAHNGKFTTINPFHIRSAVIDTDKKGDDKVHAGGYLRIKIDRLMSFFTRIYPDINTLEAADLETSMRKIYADHGLTYESEILPETYPVLHELYQDLETRDHGKNIVQALKPFVFDGTYAKLFDGPTNWGFTDSRTLQKVDGGTDSIEISRLYTRLDVHELETRAARINLQGLVMDLLLSDLWEYIKLDRKQVINLKVDEAWLLADPKNPLALRFLHDMSKRAGKYGLRLTTATQNVEDFLRTSEGDTVPYGQMIIENSGVKILFHMGDRELDKISEFTLLSEGERQVLQRPKRGNGICIVGNQHAHIQTFMTPEEMKLYDPSEYARLFA